MAMFRGVLRIGDDELRVNVSLDDQRLVLEGPDGEIGSWPSKHCRVAKREDGTFLLVIDGEEAVFQAEDPTGFSVEAARHLRGSELAERIRVLKEAAPVDTEPGGAPTGWRRWMTAAAIIAGAVLALAWVAIAHDPQPPTSSITASLPPPDLQKSVFDEPTSVFVERWNAVSEEFGAPLRIAGRPAGEFEVGLTPRLLLQVIAEPDGTLARYVLTGDPAGGPEEDRLIIASWGVAISVALPDLEAEERRELLLDLGFDLDRPDLTGLDAEVPYSGVLFSLRYLEDFQTVMFAVSEG
jgi:hypothetical protein